jgi:integrase
MPWGSEQFPRVRRPHRLPVVLSHEEVIQFFDYVPSLKYRAALMTGYGAGLRISETVSLKVSDIDSQRMLLRVEQGKGHKDRDSMLSPRGAPPRVALPRLAHRTPHLIDLGTGRLPRSRHAFRVTLKNHAAYAPPQFRNAPAGKWHRHPRHPGAAGA